MGAGGRFRCLGAPCCAHPLVDAGSGRNRPKRREAAMQEEQQQVTCAQCGRSFDSQDELDRHMEQEHGAMGGDGIGGGMGDEGPDTVGE
jgi:hypothetical protein